MCISPALSLLFKLCTPVTWNYLEFLKCTFPPFCAFALADEHLIFPILDVTFSNSTSAIDCFSTRQQLLKL